METLNNGYTPYIGANGNWYVDNEDTGVKAQGPEGEQGPVGPQGIRGPRGNAGDRGPQGIQGPIGATGGQGPKGDKGDTGFTGAKGDKGDTPSLTANLLATVPGTALDATMGKTLNDKIPVVEDISVTPVITGTYVCKKYGNVISLWIWIIQQTATNGGYICTIPSVHAPDRELYICPTITGDATLVGGYLTPGISVNEKGIVRISGFTGKVNILGYFTWVK